MLIIFGFRVRFRTIAAVMFHCPACGGDRRGEHQAARRWFTLFWIPFVPLKQAGEVVTCSTCGSRFDPSVMDQPTTESIREALGVATRVIGAMLVRTGDQGDPALRAAARATISAHVPGYDAATLASDAATLDPAYAELYAAPLADGLSVEGKERLLADFTALTLVAGTITPDQRRVLDLAGRGLGLTPAHITGIVSSVVAATSSDTGPPDHDTHPLT